MSARSLDVPRRRSSAQAPIPPAPPLPPERVSTQAPRTHVGILDRILGRRAAPKPQLSASERRGQRLLTPNFGHVSSLAASHKTGLRLRALDINEDRTHVVLAGGKILKTVKVDQGACIEDVNIRNSVVNYPRQTLTGPKSKGQSTVQPQVQDLAALQRETFDIEDVAWSNGRWSQQVATAAANGKVILYDLERPGVEVGRLHEHNRQVHKVDFSPVEGQLLLSASQDGTVRLWDLRTFQYVLKCESRDTFPGRNDGVRHTKWSPVSSATFALATDNGTVQRWDTRHTRAPVLKIAAHLSSCSSIDWHPDGRHLVSGGKDQDVSVWDLRGDRKQKPLVSLKAPYAIQNVRWRPPCYVTESDQITKQCTHLATSYKTWPVVHVWDLRRPHISFKEFHHTVNKGTTDMLWHSKDLFWTVGLEGEFTQSDVRYLPRTLDRRPLSTFSLSNNGELMAVSQPRVANSASRLENDNKTVAGKPKDRQKSKSPESRGSWFPQGDDSLDENFLSTSFSRRRQSRRSSAKAVASASSTPPSFEDHLGKPVTEFQQTLAKRNVGAPNQRGCFGHIPGASLGAEFAVAAREWRMLNTSRPMSGRELVHAIDELYTDHIQTADRCGNYEEAQAFEVLRQMAIADITDNNLLDSEFFGRASPNSSQPSSVFDKMGNEMRSPRLLNAGISRLTQALKAADDSGSVSDAATPLAKPTPDVRQADGGPPTPPLDLTFGSLDASPEQARVTPDSSMSPSKVNSTTKVSPEKLAEIHRQAEKEALADEYVVDDASYMESLLTRKEIALMEYRRSNTSSSENSSEHAKREPTKTPGLEGAINVPHERRTAHNHSHVSSSLDSARHGVPPLDRQDSADSMAFLPSSAGSIRLDSAHGSFAPGIVQNPGHSVDESLGNGIYDSQAIASSLSPTGIRSQITTESSVQSSIQETESETHRDPHFESVLVTSPLHSQLVARDALTDSAEQDQGHDDMLRSQSTIVDVTRIALPESPKAPTKTALKASKSLKTQTALKESLQHYMSNNNPGTAMAVYNSLAPVLVDASLNLPDSSSTSASDGDKPSNRNPLEILEEATGVSSLLVESFLSAYHDQLAQQQLHQDAAVVRNIAYPFFPSIYEQGLSEVDVGALCSTCNGIVNYTDTSIRCQDCHTVQTCPICWLPNSPFELSQSRELESNVVRDPTMTNLFPSPQVASTQTKDQATSLMSACSVCGHLTHLACGETWFSNPENRGVCPSCTCDCIPGLWREEIKFMAEQEAKRKAEEEKQRKEEEAKRIEEVRASRRATQEGVDNEREVSKDTWEVGESAAVRRVGVGLRGREGQVDKRPEVPGREGQGDKRLEGSRRGLAGLQ